MTEAFKNAYQNLSGIIGLWHIPEAARMVYYGLHCMLHRGADSVGIACSNGETIQSVKGLGLLSETIKTEALDELKGDLACGQIAMKGNQKSELENVQPSMVSAIQGQFCVVSSGMLSNAAAIREEMMENGLIFQGNSDAELIAHLIQLQKGTMPEKIEYACKSLTGPFTFIVMTKNTLYAARSADGSRPLFFARIGNGIGIASETAAFSMMDPKDIQEIPAGVVFCLRKDDIQVYQFAHGTGGVCSMEYVYFSRPDSMYKNRSVHSYRKEIGKALAKDEKVDADFVIGVPDTAISSATAFAQALNKPYEIGLIKNRYIGSTFVRPLAEQRKSGMRVRLNAISSMVKGKKIYLVDDSIKKGETAKRVSQLLREAGADEIHLRIASPKIVESCHCGTTFIEPDHLVARNYSDEEMCELFGVDSIRFLPLEDFQEIIPDQSCMACIKRRIGENYEQ